MSDITLTKSVRTNLLSLQNTASLMAKTQERLATGKKVNSALDNPTNFFTASALNSRASDMSSLMDSMANGVKTIEAANNGITSITKTVESMQSTLRQARQDKSFQTGTYDVTDASVLTISGGQYSGPVDIKLGTTVTGVNAEIKTVAAGAYLGATSSSSSAEGAGARTLLTNSGGGIGTGDVFTVAGIAVTAGADTTDAGLATTIQQALDADAGTVGKYTVTAGTGANAGKVIIETVDPAADAAAVTFGAGSVAATKGTTSFNYSAITSSVTVGGQSIATGATFEDFVANLQAGAEDGGYTVDFDATTKDITLTNAAYGATAPAVTGVNTNQAATGATSVIDLTGGASNASDTVSIDGVTLTLAANADEDAFGADLIAKIGADPTLNAKYTATYDSTTKQLTLTDKTTGSNRTAAAVDLSGANTAPSSAVTFTDGLDTVTGGATQTVGIVGASTEAVAAAKDEFTVSYDGKTANVSIGSVKGGIGSTSNALERKNWQDATIASVNAQLEAKGITGVEAKFDTDGKFSIVAKNAEAKTIAISGTDATTVFGTDTVSTGTAKVDGYSATGTVDKFVEEINRSQAGKLRASNDNGKLRIENLSTEELDVSFDSDGAAGPSTPVSSTIAGNAVRANLAKQFNELRDQLDKLADDASFNGINLLRGDQLTITFNENGSSSIKIQAKDTNGNERAITAANLDISSLMSSDLDTDAGIDGLLNNLSDALGTLRSQASTFGSNLSSVENRQDFTKNMINTLQSGADNLTLADMNEEAANLLALQTRQSLSSSALSMASQADQSVLQLLR